MAHLATATTTTTSMSPPEDDSSPPFTVSPTLQSTVYNAPVQTYLSANPTVTNPLASTAVFYRRHHDHTTRQEGKETTSTSNLSSTSDSKDNEPRLLLLQRAPTDTLPLKWELPGGSVDVNTDPSVIHGAVRELREETGLEAKNVVRELGVQREFYEDVMGPDEGARRTLVWRMVIFEMEVDFPGRSGEKEEEVEEKEGGGPHVRLAPGEHVRHLWCTEEQVRAGRCNGVELEFTHPEFKGIMLRAFDLHGGSGGA